MEGSLGGLLSLLFGVVLVAGISVVTTKGAAAGDMGRNGAAGIRTRHTQASDKAWRAGHAAALPLVNATGKIAGLTVVAAVAVQALAGGEWGLAVAGLGMALQVAVLLLATRSANKAAQAAHPG